MNKNEYLIYRDKLIKSIENLRHPNGAYSAALGEHYVKYSWWRDCVMINLYLLNHDKKMYEENYHNYLDALKMYEDKYDKFSSLIQDPNIEGREWRMLHPRVFAHDFSENHYEQWGWLQRDQLGLLLIGIALGEECGLKIIRDDEDREIIQLFINSIIVTDLNLIIKDSSMWEERVAKNSSSLGLVCKGLDMMKQLGFDVPFNYLTRAKNELENRLPREADDRPIDMALLVLCHLGDLEDIEIEYIVRKVELKLLTPYGVKRYENDQYYNDGISEMSWSMGLLYLGLIYHKMGHRAIAKYYLDKCMALYPNGQIAEGKYSNGEDNPNTCLGWSMSLAILLIDKVLEDL